MYIQIQAVLTLYAQGLAFLPSPLVVALFGVTPALVALLSVPLLRRRLTIFALLSCLVSASGVVLIAQPWTHTSGHHSLDAAPPAAPPSAPAPAPLLGAFASTLFVLGAAACAATYKVLFRRWHGDAPATTVITVLGCIGVWSATVGTPLLLLFDPKAFSSAAAGGDRRFEPLPKNVTVHEPVVFLFSRPTTVHRVEQWDPRTYTFG